MTATNLNPVQLGSLLGALALAFAAFLLPWNSVAALLQKSRVPHVFRGLARRRSCAILFVGVLAFGGDALVSWRKPTLPLAPDEFSYLLAADTFASGRITNPTPAGWRHFQTPEVLLRPSYQSKYPPGEAAFLAIGQWLTGSPRAGVWLSSGLACAALCWMLQAWVGEVWALYGALLATFQLAFFGRWAQSYWGGMVAMLGGALVYGAVRRIVQEDGGGRVLQGLVLGLGLLILANTRPFEGLLAAIPAGLVLALFIIRNRNARWRFSREVALPAAGLLLVGAAAMLFYNQRVTGNAWQLPYQAYQRQYDAVPNFIFQHLRPWPELRDISMRSAAVNSLAAWRWARRSYRLPFLTSKLFGFWQFAFGAALSLPFVLLVWAERWPLSLRVAQVAAFAIVQTLALIRYLFWPSSNAVWMLILLLALLVQAALLWRYFAHLWERVALGGLALVALGLMVETWRFHSHYVAPVIPLALVVVVQAIRRVWTWTAGRSAPAKVLALGMPLLVLAVSAAGWMRAPGPLELWAQQRAELEKRLEGTPGQQLVFVHYGPRHDFYQEWVQNRADLQRARVIWAREGGQEENCRLIASYPRRTVWRLDADHGRLQKYTGCAAHQGTPNPTVPVLESLPDAKP